MQKSTMTGGELVTATGEQAMTVADSGEQVGQINGRAVEKSGRVEKQEYR